MLRKISQATKYILLGPRSDLDHLCAASKETAWVHGWDVHLSASKALCGAEQRQKQKGKGPQTSILFLHQVLQMSGMDGLIFKKIFCMSRRFIDVPQNQNILILHDFCNS